MSNIGKTIVILKNLQYLFKKYDDIEITQKGKESENAKEFIL